MLCPPWKKAVLYPSRSSIDEMPSTSLSEAGVRKKGSTIMGRPDRIEGMASILMRPLAKLYSKVMDFVSRLSMKGI